MIFRKTQKKGERTEKQTSVILKRQVPIRFDEPAQSWLGGLPMMPKLIKWPRDAAGAPLHFIAQIACADLPSNLWNGLGPRTGWLLLFVETLKFEDAADGGLVNVLHVNRLGSEREPPEDTPTVRHAMSDYIDYTVPKIRSGVPKFWRKWPVDIVVQEYSLNGGEQDEWGPPHVPAEDLYNAPVSKNGITASLETGIERPLTWRGVLYFVEGLARNLKPAKFKQDFIGLGGLLGAPESDQNDFNEELKRRLEGNPACADREVGWGPRVRAITDRIKAELTAERSTGWMQRSYRALDQERARLEHWKEQYQQEIDAGGDRMDAAKLKDLKERVQYQIERIEETEKTKAYLDNLFAAYAGPEGEQRFNDEIKVRGEAHLAWGAQLGKKLGTWLNHIHAQDLDALISDADWNEVRGSFDTDTSVYWNKVHSTRVLQQTETSLSTKKHLDMAIREDLLDLYTRGRTGSDFLPNAQRDAFEQKLRYIEEGFPHRMGGQANPIQGGVKPEDEEMLLFQIASDVPMGWIWGDLGAMYVSISPRDLKRKRFKGVDATIEGS